MELKDKKCIPCNGYVPPLSEVEKQGLLSQLEIGWELIDAHKKLQKDFNFKNFKRALEFTNEVGRIAEEEKHHPEIHLSWGRCRIVIWTHTNNDLVENDFILAAKFSEVFSRLFLSKS